MPYCSGSGRDERRRLRVDLMPIMVASLARFEHLVQDTTQRVVLQRRSNTLLVRQLLGDLVVLGVSALLDLDVDAVVGRQRLFKAHADGEANDGHERAVVDRRRDVDEDLRQGIGVVGGGLCLCRRRRGRNANIRQIDDRELAQRMRVLRV